MLANRSRLELDKLKAIEDGAHQLQAKDRQIGAQIQKNVELRNELNTLKQERTREVWLLKKEIQNLPDKNKALAKNHQGHKLSTALPCFGVSKYLCLNSHRCFFLSLARRTQ
jgi:hypothetical protein